MDNNKYVQLEKMVVDEIDEYGSTPPAHVLDSQYQLLVNATNTVQVKERTPSRSYFRAIAAAAVLILSISAIWFFSRPTPLKFTFGENRTVGELSTLLEASNNQSLPVFFEGGSQFSLAAESETRVVQANSDQVHIMLDNGGLSAEVQGNGHTQWSVFAGPYEVKVVGTQFTVTWNATPRTLHVQVNEGEVLVKGRKLDKRGVAVEAGNRFTVNGHTDSFAVYPAANSPAKTSPSKTSPSITMKDANTPQPENTPSGALQNKTDQTIESPLSPKSRQDTQHKPIKKWKKLYKAKKYSEAVAAWEEEPGNTYGTASAEELYSLANAARYTRNAATAEKALLTIRRKHSKSTLAEAATYLLGKTALELSKSRTAAKRWFELYLKDYANGPMREKAMGRLMELYKQSGQQAKAQQMASQYLKKYPKGIFAKSATSMQSVQ